MNNKKLIALGMLGTTITGFALPITSFATTLQEHFNQFQADKKTDDVLKLIKESQYSENHKDRLVKSVNDISELEKTNSIDKKIEILQDSLNQVIYKMSKEDVSTYVKDDCTSYTLNLVIHSIMTLQNDNHLELLDKNDLLFDAFESLVNLEKENTFYEYYIDGIYNTVNDFTYLTHTDFSEWNKLKDLADINKKIIHKSDDNKDDNNKKSDDNKDDNKADNNKKSDDNKDDNNKKSDDNKADSNNKSDDNKDDSNKDDNNNSNKSNDNKNEDKNNDNKDNNNKDNGKQDNEVKHDESKDNHKHVNDNNKKDSKGTQNKTNNKPDTNKQVKNVVKGFPINLNNTKYIDKTDYSDGVKKQFLAVHNSFKISAVKINKGNVKKTIDEFLKIRMKPGEENYIKFFDTHLKQFNAIDFLLNKLDKKDKIELIKYFDTKMVNIYDSKERDKTIFLKTCLDEFEIKYKSDDDLMNTIVDNGLKTFFYNRQHEGDNIKGAVFVKNKDMHNVKDDGYLPGWKPWKPKAEENLPMPKIFYKTIDYKNINGNCYKVVITKDINNKVVKQQQFKAEGTYCGLVDDTKNNSTFSGTSTAMTSSQWYNLNKDKENKNSNESNKFFYYKLADSSEFVNTGINSKKNMTLSYNELKNLLYEMALKSGFQYMDDKDKFLIVIQGIPYVINESQKEFKVSEVDKMFDNNGKVEIRLMTEDEAKTINLKYKNDIKNIKGFVIDKKPYMFNKKPFVNGNSISVPIEEIAKNLNITVSEENGNYVFKKEGNTVTVQPNNNQIVANGTSIALSSTPIVKDNCLFMESKDLLKTFGYNLNVNAENHMFNIN